MPFDLGTVSSTTNIGPITTDSTYGIWIGQSTATTTVTFNSFWTASTTSVAATGSWINWADSSITIQTVENPPETEEQRARREERAEQWRQQQVERTEQRRIASERAMELLLEVLDAEQKAELEAEDRFHVVSSNGGLYEVRRGRQHNVFELDEQRRRRREFCITYPADIPDADILVSQKLMLEAHEEELHRIANIRQIIAA